MGNKIGFNWWSAYGPFDPGEDGLPHLGQVIKHHRERRGWSKEELATVLNCTARYVEMLESSKNTKMPESLPRRAFIAQVLGIPFVLLGISPILQIGKESSKNLLASTVDTLSIVNPDTMTMYEKMLAFCWEACYISSFQRAADDVAFCLSLLNTAIRDAKGIQRDQLNALRSRFYQLSGLIARDRMDFGHAVKDGTKALDLALELGNTELIAAALEHRSGTYARMKQFDLALTDIQRALPYADRSRSILKGNVYLVAAEKYTRVHGLKAEREVMGFFDTVRGIVRKGHLEGDGSFLKLNTASLHIEQAKVLTCFQRFAEAHNSYKIAHKYLSDDLTSWQANILLEEAETYLKEDEIEGCCESAIEAFKIVHSLRSPSREERLRRLHQQCRVRAPNNARVFRLGEMLGPYKAVPFA
ncbi:MAG: helix-turn-helix domain-containing protein [Ktedonobacteraceae bacterium]